MADHFAGEIKLFAGNYAPEGWALCDGSLLTISDNTTLYALLGTLYGGDGRTNFALPDLRGKIPVHMGTGPGLSRRNIGQQLGAERVALGVNDIASHTHALESSSATAGADDPTNKLLGQAGGKFFAASPTQTTTLNSASVANAGSGQSHENIMPSLCLNFIIALDGTYPSRS